MTQKLVISEGKAHRISLDLGFRSLCLYVHSTNVPSIHEVPALWLDIEGPAGLGPHGAYTPVV